MGLNFPGSTGHFVNLGTFDSSGAWFDKDETWTFLSFFRIENSAADDRTIVAKWSNLSTQRAFRIRTDAQAAPTNIEVGVNASSTAIVGGDNIALDTWYLVAVSCDGVETITLHLVDMAGTFLDDGLTGTHNVDAVSRGATDVLLGERVNSNDPMDGDLDYACYVKVQLTKEEILSYLYQPYRTVMRHHASGVVFFLKLGNGAVNSIDLSGLGNGGSITGTPTVGESPPIGPLVGFDMPQTFVGAPVADLPLQSLVIDRAVPHASSW